MAVPEEKLLESAFDKASLLTLVRGIMQFTASAQLGDSAEAAGDGSDRQHKQQGREREGTTADVGEGSLRPAQCPPPVDELYESNCCIIWDSCLSEDVSMFLLERAGIREVLTWALNSCQYGGRLTEMYAGILANIATHQRSGLYLWTKETPAAAASQREEEQTRVVEPRTRIIRVLRRGRVNSGAASGRDTVPRPGCPSPSPSRSNSTGRGGPWHRLSTGAFFLLHIHMRRRRRRRRTRRCGGDAALCRLPRRLRLSRRGAMCSRRYSFRTDQPLP
eukprot:GHVU01030247.1.p1 GENE.GHVU01030247.1~~GHVU01030247.1.p1  ORF type:complete len:277 (-),score=22.75 GHVU01030247.1:123-953(-)